MTGRGGAAHFTPHRPRSRGLPQETHESHRGSTLRSCSGCKSDCPNILTFISCHQETPCWGQDEVADCYILYTIYTIYCAVRVPPLGRSPTDKQLAGFWAGRRVGSGQGAPSFTGPSRKSAGWCLNRRWQGAGTNSTLSVFQSFLCPLPLPLPQSSPLHYGPFI